MSLPCIRHTINPEGLFGLPIRPFGLLVGTGVLLGYYVGRWRAREIGLDDDLCGNAMVFTLVVAFISAHLFSVFFYYPQDLLRDPWIIVKFWKQLSSFGGFLGAFIGGLFYFWRKGESYLKYLDAMIYSVTVGWIFGRMGCTVVHDHPGLPTDFFLGVACGPGGSVEHDLGLYELLFTLVLAVIMFSIRKIRPFYGFSTVVLFTLYAPVRFLLDYLRVDDRTYAGLTPGQYSAVLMVLGAAALAAYGLQRRKQGFAPGLEPPPQQKKGGRKGKTGQKGKTGRRRRR